LLKTSTVQDKHAKRIPVDLRQGLFHNFQLIDDATTDADLRVPPSNPFEMLSGHLDGLHCIRVNLQWRLIFEWDGEDGKARNLYLDNHSYWGGNTMLMTERKPVSVGEMLHEEFMKPLGLTQGQLADAMGVPRKHVNELCTDRRSITADTALMLARLFGNSADFWLNIQRRNDLWEALHSPERRQRIERARPIEKVA
jgi:addiction module HigA family antidote